MLDTVKFGYPVSPTNNQLKYWNHFQNNPPNYRTGRLGQTPKCWHKYTTQLTGTHGTKIQATYYPQSIDFQDEPITLIEASLPNLLYGNNVNMITNGGDATEELGSCCKKSRIIPSIDFYQAVIYRCDLCFNHNVGEYVMPYIDQLTKMKYPKKKTKPYYPADGVQFYSKEWTLSFYDQEGYRTDPNGYSAKVSVR